MLDTAREEASPLLGRSEEQQLLELLPVEDKPDHDPQASRTALILGPQGVIHPSHVIGCRA